MTALQAKAGQTVFPGLEDIIGRTKKRFEEMNAANESRYQELLQLHSNIGAQAEADVRRSGSEERGEITQDLITSGMSGTTALSALKNRSREREQREVSRVKDETALRRAGVIERRTDTGNFDQLTQLAQALGQGQGAQGRSHTVVGGSPAGMMAPGAGAGGSGGGGGRRGGGVGGGGGAGRVGTHVNQGRGHKTRPRCGYFKRSGCILPSGKPWRPRSSGGGGGFVRGGGGAISAKRR